MKRDMHKQEFEALLPDLRSWKMRSDKTSDQTVDAYLRKTISAEQLRLAPDLLLSRIHATVQITTARQNRG